MTKRSFFKTLGAIALAPVAGISSAIAKPTVSAAPVSQADGKPLLVPSIGYTQIGGMAITGYRWCVQFPNGTVRETAADIELHKRICKVLDENLK